MGQFAKPAAEAAVIAEFTARLKVAPFQGRFKLTYYRNIRRHPVEK
jgi:hypothetical protein